MQIYWKTRFLITLENKDGRFTGSHYDNREKSLTLVIFPKLAALQIQIFNGTSRPQYAQSRIRNQQEATRTPPRIPVLKIIFNCFDSSANTDSANLIL